MAKGIPTEYAGVNFRSRLEARWAAFFDLVGWKWEYEPLDLDGYIPDFVVQLGKPTIVEVKPILPGHPLTDDVKLPHPEWRGPWMIVGASIGPGWAHDAGSGSVGTFRYGPGVGSSQTTIKSGFKYRARLNDQVCPLEFVQCDTTGIGVQSIGRLVDQPHPTTDNCWCGCLGCTAMLEDRVKRNKLPDLLDTWRQAGNTVQWKAVTPATARRQAHTATARTGLPDPDHLLHAACNRLTRSANQNELRDADILRRVQRGTWLTDDETQDQAIALVRAAMAVGRALYDHYGSRATLRFMMSKALEASSGQYANDLAEIVALSTDALDEERGIDRRTPAEIARDKLDAIVKDLPPPCYTCMRLRKERGTSSVMCGPCGRRNGMT